MDKICLINVEIVFKHKIMPNAFLLIREGIIDTYGHMDDCPKMNNSFKVFDCLEMNVLPGMIDIHVHGAGGADFMDATSQAIDTIAHTLAKEGTTSYLATTMTSPDEQIRDSIFAISTYMEDSGKVASPELLGIHLEGPFINLAQKGAQPASSIISSNLELFNEWQLVAKDAIRIVTFAPELDVEQTFLKGLQEQGVLGSMGHTDATYEQAKVAIDAGVSHATHLFNGMSGLHQREPGVLGAALLSEEVYVELIPDGFHFHPDLLKLVLRLKGIERILVITDGMRAKGMPDGKYDLGGNNVVVNRGKCTLEDGSSLAGSIITMNEARKNMEKWLGLSLIEQAQITSLNQAKRLGVEHRKGSIQKGKDADLTVIDADGNVSLTICNGEIAYLNKVSFYD
ncbi:N-acetylglucosamine-6-phosphate deacetylase [Sporosarcina aquimarina]|uniref:N-acetylglucosamine-6-phosphate deacetylase n=1 Tax=Sporosarcina aquimarina TaxID=114975 RepID=UPI002040135D|nr:N-acetylglucosamine-6-phosphate deacetylase [Sporosarcina aquimarina]MCM3758411.1 N-acetylglucosamine-6-phosphate deacetylase [Sporosarcina aquimarina]